MLPVKILTLTVQVDNTKNIASLSEGEYEVHATAEINCESHLITTLGDDNDNHTDNTDIPMELDDPLDLIPTRELIRMGLVTNMAMVGLTKLDGVADGYVERKELLMEPGPSTLR